VNTTSLTLLERLRQPGDQEAWARFVKLYTPLLYFWSRRAGLQEQDAADLVQDVFALLIRKLPAFQHNRQGSFRAWLRAVTLNKWREVQRRSKGPQLNHCKELEQMPAPDHSTAFDEREYRTELVGRALQILQPDFSHTTWQAFQAHVVAGRDAREVASELGIRIGTVYAAKSRVLTRLRQQLDGLLG